MTRLLHEHPRIEVEIDAAGQLVAIVWSGRRETVEVCNRWLALVYFDGNEGTWHLERLYD